MALCGSQAFYGGPVYEQAQIITHRVGRGVDIGVFALQLGGFPGIQEVGLASERGRYPLRSGLLMGGVGSLSPSSATGGEGTLPRLYPRVTERPRMPECKNCNSFVTAAYARVFTPNGVEQPRVCPNCVDKIRDGAEVRDTRTPRK